MSEVVVSFSGLTKSFPGMEKPALDTLDGEILAGRVTGLVGPDGAGKTTLLRLIAGLLVPGAGSLTTLGEDPVTDAPAIHGELGYMPQKFGLYEDLTVLENIRFFAEARGLKSNEWLPRSLEILEFVGLEKFKDRRAGQLSGGMKQKLGLASALVTKPRVLLLDEPTTGVDPVTRQDFWQLVIKLVSPSQSLALSGVSRSLANADEAQVASRPSSADFAANAQSSAQGDVAVLISTPYMDEASRCHRVGFMKNGKIIAEDTPSNLRARLNNRVLELRGSPINLLRHVAHNDRDVEDVQAFGDRLHIRVGERKADDVLSRLKSAIRSEGGRVDELRAVSPVLEDVFIALSSPHHVHDGGIRGGSESK